MTKQEKTKATKVTKEADRLFEIFFSVVKDKDLAIACTDIAICSHISNSKGKKLKSWQEVHEKLKFWQEVRKRLRHIYLRENKQYK